MQKNQDGVEVNENIIFDLIEENQIIKIQKKFINVIKAIN